MCVGALRTRRYYSSIAASKSPTDNQLFPTLSTAHPASSNLCAKAFLFSGELSNLIVCLPRILLKPFKRPSSIIIVLFLSRPIAILASKIKFCLGCPSNLVSSSSSPRAPGSVRFLPSCTVFPLGSQYYLERVPEKSYFHLKSPLLVIKYYVIRITSYVIRVVLVVVPF